ncbi:MAG: diguanylate cyclase [Burkholderiaceae bacterium]|nr:diguanylate cyclase [Burkholderiaceae bacterium]
MNKLEQKLSRFAGHIKLKSFTLWVMMPLCLIACLCTIPIVRFMDDLSDFSTSLRTRMVPQIVNTQATFVNLESLNKSLNVMMYANDTERVRHAYIDTWSVLMESLYDRPAQTQALLYSMADEVDVLWQKRQALDRVRESIFHDWQTLYTQGVSLHVLTGTSSAHNQGSVFLSYQTLGQFSLHEKAIRESARHYFSDHLGLCKRTSTAKIASLCLAMTETKQLVDEHFAKLEALSDDFIRQTQIVNDHMLQLTEQLSSLEISTSMDTVDDVSYFASYAKHLVLFFGIIFGTILLMGLLLIGFVVLPLSRLSAIGRDFRTKMNRPSHLPTSIVYEIQELIRLMPLLFNDIEQKHQRSETLARENEELSEQTQVDALTGIANRRVLEQYEHQRLKAGSAVLMFDIDYFKRINDTKGHPYGDYVLQTFAKVLRDHLQRDDVLCRYGGEEFCAILHRVNQLEAKAIAQRLLDLIRVTPFEDENGPLYLTMSVGVSRALLKDGEYTIDEMIDQADKALYEAKSHGRDRIWVCGGHGESIR